MENMAENGNTVTLPAGVLAARHQREWEQRQKHRERARTYYLRHRKEVIEKAKNNYYRKQEEQKEKRKRAEETTVMAEKMTEIHAEKTAEKAEKPEKSEITMGIWGDVVIIGMIAAAVVWVAVLVIREWQSQSEASEALRDSNTSGAPQESQIPAARLAALIEREKNYAEIRRILAEASA